MHEDNLSAAGEGASVRAAAMDRHVGARMRQRRMLLGLSQQQFASAIGVTYQQANKYERGLNRISAGRLFEIAEALGAPVGWFFEGEMQHDRPTARRPVSLELVRNFEAIDAREREAVSQLLRTLALQSKA